MKSGHWGKVSDEMSEMTRNDAGDPPLLERAWHQIVVDEQCRK
jgi:hypothetical protein